MNFRKWSVDVDASGEFVQNYFTLYVIQTGFLSGNTDCIVLLVTID